MTFGEKLQKLRARAGLSQDQLAELLDVSRQAVSKWERNEAMPEAEKLVRISRQFGVSTDYLLLEEREEPETPKAQTPASGLWARVKQWYRNKGYLLAWALAAWGGVRLADTGFRMVRFYQTCQYPGFNWKRFMLDIYIPEMISAVLFTLAASVLALWGRRLTGRLRGYHLGWLLLLTGLLGAGGLVVLPAGMTTDGVIGSLASWMLYDWHGGAPRGNWVSSTDLLVAVLGLMILLLGRRRERKRAFTKIE